ncbi:MULTISPECIES: SLBB domain-containing protein [unclassified Sphingomonas]|uniref:SLBB domain-containing protein n=1 Tax=unclassified Sphingomonas TaxID=196159 RepID=UPI000A6F8544|nr:MULTISPECIES: SLBB domain-containing protein [unclassified Sphingomonas]
MRQTLCLLRRLALLLIASFALTLAPGIATAQQTQMSTGQAPLSTAPAAPQAAPARPAADAAGKDKQQNSLADGYVLGVGDVIEVSVLGREEFKPRVQVQVDGTIQLPYIKSVPAEGKTVLQLREEVRHRLQQGGYYTDPVVSVIVASYTARYVTVLGEVGNPGLVPVDRAYRLSEILARVGGLRPTGSDDVQIRRADGKEFNFDMRDIAGGGPDKDIFVEPGDKIYVAAATTFYIYGQVAQPGSYRIDRGMTLRQALARAGGLTPRGSDKKVKLFRDGKEMGRMNLSDPVKNGDTIVIGERFF